MAASRTKKPVPLKRLALHLMLLGGVVISLFPFYWTAVMATNTTRDIYSTPPKLVFGPELFNNISRVFETIDFTGSFLNTLTVACCTTVLVLFFDSLAAFTFAKYEFPGRKYLFGALLLTFMLPAQLSLIPQFVIMVNIGWVGTIKALIIPAAANAFGIFWMRQYIMGAVPDDLIAAARLDGAGFFRQYWNVALPIIRPGLAFLGIFTFIGSWNDYAWPLIVMTDPSNLTLQVALSQLNTAHNTDYSMVMAGALLAVAPLVVVFALFARGFVADAVKGALRG
ncbi:carbohydrate ABC transporter permease [Planotetraspora sp. A-T 1434]|uniref:carbohydrate ABC transporter permease n=1 Tax=Planotetraspora sp. A-T 1434 TaxID=2979219 RepID=UPI0021C0B7CC|nr:carbohydrate ABC transporter permease [Planotetraspora sp. A-T 1434]MCT9929680.1 carbohydrate ABC transporter permease [Planotetraspora sp. A-T 1434]